MGATMASKRWSQWTACYVLVIMPAWSFVIKSYDSLPGSGGVQGFSSHFTGEEPEAQ